ncbi:C4b-binding protein alpha chain [Lemur catta]|uniref:C4b-binding protein alpha chain n=1 Tax=Lemur catta TaxID=9447 RepID=UPI001E267E11|nr:C4b-binding protein alpha chain [Lemur catta]XP_045392043.1 C4b-binding protein alpha chain [Lemur catta]XP_045392044.1 C4b-binding protein alpha chain [Lemur catta]XP_045392045.1 C4b-binding protein alpha chain [Lemur catta]XP_045392046.1 C4b-binding protein alpha chain [Lemur catta]XP_045392047.1 C4b-binding protein alpha chain [Lemur catta]
MLLLRAPQGTLHRKGEMAVWSLSGLWKVSDPTLFQMTLVAALLATVFGNCGPPPILQFASPVNQLNETEFQSGSSLRYNCRPGYSRTSSNQFLTCKEGQWSYSTFCVKKRCRNPGDLPNGHVEVKTDFFFGSQITFSCFTGYILIGSSTSHCDVQDKGVDWSDPLPQCVIVQCESPPDIKNGKHSGGDEDIYTYGSSVTYSCDNHFSLIGKASISCTVENKTIGVWSPSPPTCEQITCPKPNVPHGSIVSGFGPIYMYKDTIMFNCHKGFILKGSSVIHCEVDNTWDPSPPTCELNSCTDLPDIPHASWERYPRPTKEQIYAIGTVLKYHCLPGYTPAVDEPTTVTCQKNLRWTPYKGCKESCCPIPDLRNGEIIQHRKNRHTNDCMYFYGDQLLYSCPGNLRFSATCQPDGTWSPQTPSCDDNCHFPPTIAHGHPKRVQTYSLFREDVIYECDTGYTLVGQAKISCSFSLWTPSAPQCKALCVKPEIANGKPSVEKDQYVELEDITIQCDSGYRIVGPESITCSENRTWYPDVPKCEWEIVEGCEQVLTGRKLMQCLPKPEDVKLALEVYKLSLEIELLERDKARLATLEKEL